METFGAITFFLYQVVMYGALALTLLITIALFAHSLAQSARDAWIDISYYHMKRQQRRAARRK